MWDKIKAWFKDSETLFIARLKIFIGTIFTAIQQSGVDLTTFVESSKVKVAIQVFMAWLVVDGTIAEWARRRRSDL